MNARALTRAFVSWVPLAVAIVGLCGLVYVAVQQDYRRSLNDPQIQMAEDGAAALKAGAVPAALVTRGVTPIDISTSLAAWIAVYDQSGQPLESDAVLEGAPPKVPQGVIAAAVSGEDRVTWQPESAVRQAIVVVYAGNYTVVAGRNMREVETRESDLEALTATAMLVILLATLLASVFVESVRSRWNS